VKKFLLAAIILTLFLLVSSCANQPTKANYDASFKPIMLKTQAESSTTLEARINSNEEAFTLATSDTNPLDEDPFIIQVQNEKLAEELNE
jgi:hypothetical protein